MLCAMHMTVFMVMTVLVVARGVEQGQEEAAAGAHRAGLGSDHRRLLAQVEPGAAGAATVVLAEGTLPWAEALAHSRSAGWPVGARLRCPPGSATRWRAAITAAR